MANNPTKPALDRVRTFNKYVLNPVMLRLAGRAHWYAAVIHHTGRNSGRSYRTPVVADRIDDGFIVPLPYGTHVDWLLNTIAGNSATITAHGQTSAVTNPQIIDWTAALPLLKQPHRRVFNRFGVKNYVRFKEIS